MNHFKLTTLKDRDGDVIGPNEVYAHLSPFSEETVLGEQFRSAFELEILKGRQLPDGAGGVHYWFELDDEKMVRFRQWLTLAYFQPEAN